MKAIEAKKPKQPKATEKQVEYNFCFTADFDKFKSLDVRDLPSVSEARKFSSKTVWDRELKSRTRHIGSPEQIRYGFHTGL